MAKVTSGMESGPRALLLEHKKCAGKGKEIVLMKATRWRIEQFVLPSFGERLRLQRMWEVSGSVSSICSRAEGNRMKAAINAARRNAADVVESAREKPERSEISPMT